jgi:hypothetical protein
MNFASLEAQLPAPTEGPKVVDVNARIVRAGLRDPGGTRTDSVAEGAPIQLDVVLVAARPLHRPLFTFHVRDDEGRTLFELGRQLDAFVAEGRHVSFAGPVENRLVPGRYTLDVYVREDTADGAMTVQGLRLGDFVVTGETSSHGVIRVQADVEPVLEDPA